MFYWQFMRNKMLKTVGRDITITSTTLPFTILRAKGGNLINYTISGNSTQNGTPTPTDPIAIQSVGNSILPSGYTQVEWIKSDGSAYLQTSLTSYKNTYTYKIGVKRYDTTTKFVAFQNPYENLGTIGMFAYGTGFYVQNGVKYPQRVSISVDTNSFHDIVIESNGCSVDGTKTRFTPASEFTVSQSLYVFAGADPLTGDVDYRISTNALSYFEIYDENNNLVLNLIPAKNSSNEYGMYDLVSNTFFTNAGSGAFTAGPVASEVNIPVVVSTNSAYVGLPSGYTQVEYLEAVGTGTGAGNIYHIDTGIACSLDMEVETNIKHIGTDSNLLTPYAIGRNQGTTGIGLSHYSSGPAWAVKFGSAWANKGTIVKDTWYNIVHNKDEFILNGTSSSLTNSATLTSNLYIMTDIWSSAIPSTTKLQMKNFIIRKSGTVVFNGIACKDNSTNKYGMYDTISGSFFGNGGSGTFTAGPEITGTTTNITLSEPLRKVGTYADKLEYVTLLRTNNVAKKVLDGTESWAKNGDVPGLFHLSLSDSLAQTTAPYVGYCTHFINNATQSAGNLANGEFNYNTYGSNARVNIKNTDYSGNLAGFKTWLATQYANGTPVTIYYPLATQATTSVTLPTISVSAGTNIIDVQTTVKPSEVSVKYKQ